MEDGEVSIQISKDQKKIEMHIVSEGNNVILMPPESKFCSVCVFSGEANTISESIERRKSVTKLSGLIVFYVVVMLVEIIGGVKANSLAVMTDAAHLLTDVAGFSISLFTVWASAWKATSYQSFGFNRLEVLGALLSVQLIWLISALLLFEAVDRILHEHDKVNGALMFAVAAFGFCVNLVMVLWLGHDHTLPACGGTDHHQHRRHDLDHHHHNHEHERGQPSHRTEDEETNLVLGSTKTNKILNINLQGAYLHVMADLIQSVGVMIAGAVIWIKPEWLIIDLLCTLIFSTFALSTTLPMLRDIFSILMERTPRDIDIDMLESGIKGINGVHNIHDLHVWAITVGKLVLSCHVEAEPGTSPNEILREISDYCEKTYEIHNVTIQIE
ncbi:Detected protein of confused Function [Hibiscus syriacus]|uniref:Detected protein of confused Function n=1 Tax=Hibiscus syriacus TaxID=106335 RepID=A0A6A3D145_HIBSY|nr:metal tolerance protein B-like [Hibiscus syriacus]KAE8733019.1 Detected protein of confused Function [Hibiscus syriacus]